MVNRDGEATAYRAGLDAAANDAQNTIADAEAALKRIDSYSTKAVRDAEKAYQEQRLRDAKASLAKVEKAQKAEQADAEKAQKATEDAAAARTAKQSDKTAQA